MENKIRNSLQAYFSEDWFTPRRVEILVSLESCNVEIDFLDSGLDSLRIYVPHGVPEEGFIFSALRALRKKLRDGELSLPERISALNPAALASELFDPVDKSPLEFIDSYPAWVRYGIQYTVRIRLGSKEPRQTKFFGM